MEPRRQYALHTSPYLSDRIELSLRGIRFLRIFTSHYRFFPSLCVRLVSRNNLHLKLLSGVVEIQLFPVLLVRIELFQVFKHLLGYLEAHSYLKEPINVQVVQVSPECLQIYQALIIGHLRELGLD